MQAVASLRYGVIFKKAFSQPDIFTAFVKDILGIELDIDRVETEKSFPSPVGSIDSRFDLFAEDKTQRIIVDIQHRRYSDHYPVFCITTVPRCWSRALPPKIINPRWKSTPSLFSPLAIATNVT
ncbi:MAG: hypothetical protein L3K52_18000 [Candidatus Thiothrix sulfatifontis]|nr:MAG: hypothetical protein L3K52_18000 [Candidatus Thiothrix sulfatifontis]